MDFDGFSIVFNNLGQGFDRFQWFRLGFGWVSMVVLVVFIALQWFSEGFRAVFHGVRGSPRATRAS